MESTYIHKMPMVTMMTAASTMKATRSIATTIPTADPEDLLGLISTKMAPCNELTTCNELIKL